MKNNRYTKIRGFGPARAPGTARREARNSDTESNPLRTAKAVPDVVIAPIAPQTTGATLADVTALMSRIRVLESSYNKLLASLREGQVIDER